MPRQGSYLFKRRGSQNWWVRFQYPNRIQPHPRKVEISLRTPDRTEAEIKALPMIHAHRAQLLVRRAALEGRMRVGKGGLQYEPGREHHTVEGERLLAVGDQLFFLDESGQIVRTERNAQIYLWK